MLAFGQAAGFLVAAVLITLAPGPDNLMVLGLGLSRGRRLGMVFGLGCALGCISHTLLAAFGISAMIAASPALFAVFKVAGGLYLVWLGIKAFRRNGQTRVSTETGGGTGRSLFLRGLFANAINPKVALFFLAFLPQFIAPARGMVWWQTIQFGLLFTVQAAILFAVIGYFSGHVGQWIARKPAAGRWLDRLSGGVFMLFGARLILAR
jgi:threonine/homoserine/homoserine lactone efflux protein